MLKGMSVSEKLAQYAELIAEVGLNVQAGQKLMITAPLEASPLLREVARAVYQRGALYVQPFYTDDGVTLERYEHAPKASFDYFPQWLAEGMLDIVKGGGARLAVTGSDPDLLQGQNGDDIAALQKVSRTALKPVMAEIMKDAVNWCVVAVVTPAWAQKVFPDLPVDQAQEKLWDAIFAAVRVGEGDALSNWKRHLEELDARSLYLNQKAYSALRYRAEGTDLTVGLADGHIWKGGASRTTAGTDFVPNLPTEEVFTAPHRAKVEGTVKSTKPLSYGGQLIRDFSLTFRGGEVVGYEAAAGKEALGRLLQTDAGAKRLGEVALVPHSSPISQSGLLFYNTLFDENAASHLALGAAYRFCAEGGTEMSEQDAEAVGLNESLAHEDFMIGSAEMQITGVSASGEEEPVMEAGEWAFDL